MVIDPEARMRGNHKPSGYPEYDNLTGYLERTYQVEWRDKDGIWWRKTCQVINLGRPDRGVPVDVEALEAQEVWGDGEVTVERGAKAKRGEVIGMLVDALREGGPMTTPRLASRVGRVRQAIQNTLTGRGDLFMRVSGPSKRGVDTTWGLVGVHDGKLG